MGVNNRTTMTEMWPRSCLRRQFLRSVFLLFPLWLAGSSFGQQLIENSDKPLAKDASRVLALREVWRISDDSGAFYFMSPKDLKVSADGSVFLAEEAELLRFSSNGKYLKNLIKIGQGPNEVSSSFRYVIKDKLVNIYDFAAVKIIRFDLDGNFLSSMKIETGPYSDFIGYAQNDFVFLKYIFPSQADRKTGLQKMPVVVKLVSNDGKTEKDGGSFQKEIFVSKGITSWTNYRIALDDLEGLAYVSDTREYLISVLDILSGRMKKLIKRKYASIPYKERGWEANFYKTNQVPKIKNEIDVVALFNKGGDLWVKTSTTSKEKGELIDTFDIEGRFSDSFYLGPGRTLLGVRGDDIYVTEKSVDDTIVLVKYTIVR
jgi:hypothetical protein